MNKLLFTFALFVSAFLFAVSSANNILDVSKVTAGMPRMRHIGPNISAPFDLPIVATYYCSLTDPGTWSSCNPGACGLNYYGDGGWGIVAFNPLFYDGGDACQYQGGACGSCWNINGPAGSANVIVSDCCAGYPGACSCLDCPGQSGCNQCGPDNFHFDLDIDTFNRTCGPDGYQAGHCQLNSANQISC